jgi:phenylalanyl-tRNA synthetase alpha chain
MSSETLDQLSQSALQAINQSTNSDQLAEAERSFLGRKSALAQLSQSLGTKSADERVALGKQLNMVRKQLTEALAAKREALDQSQPLVDLTIPAKHVPSGHLHLTTQTTREIVRIFGQLGMHFYQAPEVDYDWYAFEALNMGVDHPARDEWETFFTDLPDHPERGKVVLTPHTTNFEAHIMEEHQPPFRFITVGKTYRRQSDASHVPMFHQFEGFVVDKGLSIGNLIATLEYFVHNYFGPEVKTRLRPYHFRFTEPSFELDISCTVCGGTGCKLCKEGWLELGGAGMTHPAVLKNGGLDPAVHSGFAWGWGVERCFAIRHRIDDIRMIYDNDLRFLEQF